MFYIGFWFHFTNNVSLSWSCVLIFVWYHELISFLLMLLTILMCTLFTGKPILTVSNTLVNGLEESVRIKCETLLFERSKNYVFLQSIFFIWIVIFEILFFVKFVIIRVFHDSQLMCFFNFFFFFLFSRNVTIKSDIDKRWLIFKSLF